MRLRRFLMDDYEDVANMLHLFYKEVFSDKRKIGSKYFFYKEVNNWINSRKDIIIAEDKDFNIVGFSLCYKDDCGGLTETVYTCDYCYIKEEFRKTRAAYMLYTNGYNYAKESKLNLVTNGRVENGVSKMMNKHFDLTSMFINYERNNNG